MLARVDRAGRVYHPRAMNRHNRGLRRQVESVGRAPGTLATRPDAAPTTIDVTVYDTESHEKRRVVADPSLAELAEENRVVWVDVTGLGDQAALELLRSAFDLPWLAMEDVVHGGQRPKAETYGDARFIVMKQYDRPGAEADQFSIFVRHRLVVTFQERPGDPFDALRRRLTDAGSQARRRGPDYLVYRMLDACVDSVFPEMQRLADAVEQIEDVAIVEPSGHLIRELHATRRELRLLERRTLAMRDTVSALWHDEDAFFDAATRPYLRDVLDHATQLVDLSHFYTSVANDVGALVIGTLDLRMNQIMKALAAVTVVFLPLSLIAGIYGMNFRNMPELEWSGGYYGALALIAVTAAALTLWLRRRGWVKSDI
jgi:magnesium transporter